jgi:hypothetical protein
VSAATRARYRETFRLFRAWCFDRQCAADADHDPSDAAILATAARQVGLPAALVTRIQARCLGGPSRYRRSPLDRHAPMAAEIPQRWCHLHAALEAHLHGHCDPRSPS